MERVWYLLRNRRCEGPFELEDLNVQAQQGQLSPDDYVIEEQSFSQGQMIYRRAAEILPREAFSLALSVPEAQAPRSILPGTRPAGSSSSGSYRPVEVSRPHFQESVSPLKDLLGRLSFGNVAGFCAVVLGASWFFETQNPTQESREPAEYVERSANQESPRALVRQSKRPRESSEAPTEKLLPSERPTRSEMAQGRSGSRVKLKEQLNDRGLASEGEPPERVDPASGDGTSQFPEQRPTIEGEEPQPLFEEEAYIEGGEDPEALIEPASIDVPEGEAY